MAEPLTVELYTPHAGQMKLHESRARFRCMSCGRRFGKTYCCCNEGSKHALEHPGSLVMWVAPSYRQTQIAFRLMAKALKPVIAGEPNKSELRIPLINDSTIVFASAERYDNLRGEGVDFLIMDEVGQIDERAWTESLRPTLSDTNGRAVFIGTPRGRNWFWDIFQRGLKTSPTYDPEWESFTFPTSANPYIPRKELVSVRKQIPEDTYRQEYLAEFLEESAGVFRNIEACVDDESFAEYRRAHTYVVGWDVAKHEDFSVVTVFNVSTRRVDYWERFNRIDYTYQLETVERIARQYHASVIMDATAVGEPLEEQLTLRGLYVEGIKYNNINKEQHIRNLAMALEQATFRMPRIPALIDELRTYEYHFTPQGSVTYSAPSGKHDDCVISLALVLWKAKDSGDIAFFVDSIPDAKVVMPLQEYDDAAVMRRQEQMANIFGFLRDPDYKIFSNGWLDRK